MLGLRRSWHCSWISKLWINGIVGYDGHSGVDVYSLLQCVCPQEWWECPGWFALDTPIAVLTLGMIACCIP